MQIDLDFKGTTQDQERTILSSPSTHRLVREVVELAESRDCVDAYFDIHLAAQIIKGRMDRACYDHGN